MANLQAALASSASFLTGWAARTFGQVLPRQHDPFPPGDAAHTSSIAPMQPRAPLPRLDDGERRKAPWKAGWKCAPRGTPEQAGDGDDDPRRDSAERWSRR